MKVSIVIPCYNEEKCIVRCLDSIAKQTIKDVEAIIVDDNSTDDTVKIAKQYPFVKIIKSGFKDPEISKKLALNNASGTYFMYTDADMAYCDDTFLETMLAPMEKHLEVTGTLARFQVAPDMNALTRYISYDEFQRDAFLQLFTPSINPEPGAEFYEFSEDFMPCQSLILYRTEVLKEVLKDRKHFMDNDVLVLAVHAGYKYYAYPLSRNCIYHYYFQNLKELCKKKAKGVKNSYLPNMQQREYKWINLKKKSNLLLLIGWTIWANLFIPELIKGIFKCIKYKDWCFFYEPVVSMLGTDVMIFEVLRSGVSFRKLLNKI